MNKRLLIFLFFNILLLSIKSQQIRMNFPKFAGKTYDFIIFQGNHQQTVYQGVIPDDGKFTLTIPEIYATYTGMSRWLITGTKEGGGLDMFIPGHDFSVSCSEARPDEKNIIYVNNTGNNKLNDQNRIQEGILSRYQAMLMATKSYDVSSPHYSLFRTELKQQQKDYSFFQKDLRKKTDYISRFLSILNIYRGMGEVLTDREDEKAKDIAQYISKTLDWNSLYTSGYWNNVIESWVNIHTNVLKDPVVFSKEFKSMASRMPSPELYTDFCNRVTYALEQLKKDDYIKLITPSMTNL